MPRSTLEIDLGGGESESESEESNLYDNYDRSVFGASMRKSLQSIKDKSFTSRRTEVDKPESP